MGYLGSTYSTFDPTRTIGAPRDADRFSGNGSTTAFTLTRSVDSPTDIEVFVGNVRQEPLTSYSVSGTTLTFTGAPGSGTNNIYVIYRAFNSNITVTLPDGAVSSAKLANNIRLFTVDNYTANGSATSFALSETPASANTLMVAVNGILQSAPNNYTVSGSTITFTSAPAVNANVTIRHLGFRTTTTITALAANSTITQPVLSGSVTGTYTLAGTPTISSPTLSGTVAGTYTLGGTPTIRVASGTAGAPSLANTNDTLTGIFFPAANTIAFSTASTERMRLDSSGNLQFNSGYGSAATAYGCRAWVNFNGTSTVAIRASGNVSSITDNGTGDYTVNFTTAMPDANFSAVATVSRFSPENENYPTTVGTGRSPTTSTVRLYCRNYAAAASEDSSNVNVAIFR